MQVSVKECVCVYGPVVLLTSSFLTNHNCFNMFITAFSHAVKSEDHNLTRLNMVK